MHLTKLPSHIYVEKTPEQCCLGCHNSQKTWEGIWWDKHSSSGLHNQQIEGQKRLYNVRDPPGIGGGSSENWKESTVVLRTQIVFKFERNIIKNYPPSSDFDQGRISLHKACLSLSSYHFFHYECCLSYWSLVFSLLSTNFMHLAL